MSTRESICRLTLTQCIDYNKDDNQNLDLRVVHNISAHLPDAVDLFHGRVRRRETIERRLFFDRPIVGVAALCCRLLCLGLAIVAFGSRRFEDGHRRFCVTVVLSSSGLWNWNGGDSPPFSCECCEWKGKMRGCVRVSPRTAAATGLAVVGPRL